MPWGKRRWGNKVHLSSIKNKEVLLHAPQQQNKIEK
jgi:hypothetical protein